MKRLEEKRAALNKATGMGDAILAICHPDSITTIKHWITIIRARFEEVSEPQGAKSEPGWLVLFSFSSQHNGPLETWL